MAQVEEEEDWALMYVCVEPDVNTMHTPNPQSTPPPPAAVDPQPCVHLIKEKVLHLSDEGRETLRPRRWVLDTGVTNHMSGSRAVFTELNTRHRHHQIQ